MIPFRAAHVREIMPDASDKIVQSAIMAERTGPAFTACLYGHYIGAAGVSIQKPGVGEAWTLFRPAMKALPLWMHREVKTRLQMVIEQLDEVWAVCRPENARWLTKLGMFHVEQADRPELYRKVEPGEMLFVRRK